MRVVDADSNPGATQTEAPEATEARRNTCVLLGDDWTLNYFILMLKQHDMDFRIMSISVTDEVLTALEHSESWGIEVAKEDYERLFVEAPGLSSSYIAMEGARRKE